MAAACTVGEGEGSNAVNEELLEAQIVAQAITELQEVQAPVSQGIGGEVIDASVLSSLTAAVDGTSDSLPAQTHVIYYIEDGVAHKEIDRRYVDTSVQANDYDIERRSGKLPARKRVIPVKFRDYKNASDPDTSDSDFDPHDYVRNRRPVFKKRPTEQKIPDHGRRVGRPKKSAVSQQSYMEMASPRSSLAISEEMSQAIEEKYQQALRAAQDQAEKRRQAESQGDEQAESRVTVKIERPDGTSTEEDLSTKEGQSDEHDKEDVDVRPVRRGPGRPRGPDWGSDFKCPDCGKVFKIKGNLRMHLKTHLNLKPFLCTEENCGKTFSSNESLRRHFLSHQGIKPFVCDLCQAAFSSNLSLTEHRTTHFDQKLYTCPHCERGFRHVSSFKRHVLTHSSQLPFECSVCGKRFAQAPYLRSHMKVHTGEKRYECPICHKKFAYQSDVKRHQTTHTGEKPYQCSKCNARFSDVSSKGRHEKEHENVKRFTCALCNDTFKRSGQLRSHLARKHGQSMTVKLQKNFKLPGALTLHIGDDIGSVNIGNQRIVSLIKNLHSKTSPGTGFVEVEGVPDLQFQISDSSSQQTDGSLATGAMVTDHVTDIGQLEKEVVPGSIEGDIVVPIELQGVEVPGGEAGHTYITITDLAESLAANNTEGETKYRVLYEVDASGEQRQILVPFNDSDVMETLEYDAETGANIIPNKELVISGVGETVIETMQQTTTEHEHMTSDMNEENTEIMQIAYVNEEMEQTLSDNMVDECLSGNREQAFEPEKVAGSSVVVTSEEIVTESLKRFSENDISEVNQAADVEAHNGGNSLNARECNNDSVDIHVDDSTLGSSVDYVNCPDFSKQEYYNWLTNFTELCKVVPMPLETSLFQKISQVHKTVSDVMARPSGVVADKENFIVLMNITKELSSIVNEHLMFVMQNLEKTGDNGDHEPVMLQNV